nr:pre-mycofactocin synthase MftD [Actinomadura sp. CNU-125]
MRNLSDAGMKNFKLSVVCTRHNIPQMDDFKAIADEYGAQLRLTRLRPSGRGADVWDELHPTQPQQRELYDWLVAHGDQVLTGDSFFHLSAYGQALPGLNLCGAGRVVCLIDPVGDVYACPFAIHDEFLAGNVRETGGFARVWRESELFAGLREPQTGGACSSCNFYDTCKGGCMAAKFFTGLPLDGPDPECVQGYGEQLLAGRPEDRSGIPKPSGDHSHRTSPPRRGERGDAPPGARPGPARAARRRGPSARERLRGEPPRRIAHHLTFPSYGDDMFQNPWFETVAEAQRRAKRRLPHMVYGALVAGSERGRTIGDNCRAFGDLGFAPHVAGHHAERDLATTVMGVETSMPVVVSPTGVQAVHPEGEVAVARAAANRGVIMGLSSFASKPVEEVAEANPNVFFQMYWSGDRDAMVQRMDRARRAGAKALIATLDWSFSNGRDWGSPMIPDKIDFKTAAKLAPGVLPHPGWLWRFAKTGRIPDLTTPNLQPPHGPAPTFFGAYGEWMQTPPPTWEDVAWLRKEWGGPFMLKGVTRVDDAKRAVDAGVTALSVSNHGGNNLETRPRRSACCRRSRPRSATRSRCCWTAGCGAAGTSPRRSRSAPAPY